jgi:hypothetical protein
MFARQELVIGIGGVENVAIPFFLGKRDVVRHTPEHLLNRFKRLPFFAAPEIPFDQYRARVVR